MRTSIYVISDLHLGGDVGFQMCSPAGQRRLVDFIGHVAAQPEAGHRVHLIINGDIVDFLAEREFSSFTNSDEHACRKLNEIMTRCSAVWTALAQLVSAGIKLTLLLGNHDLELSFPGPRRLLMERLGTGVDFLYDNQAFVEGPVLIEHGNRYDKWNVVSHDTLRAIRSAMSRREPSVEYLGPPGSRLVQTVLNPLKKKYPWVDLLKPENEAVLPILAVLDPVAMRNVPQLAALTVRAARVATDAARVPTDARFIAAANTAPACSDPMLELALQLAGVNDQNNLSAPQAGQDLLARLRSAIDVRVRDAIMNGLHVALRSFAKSHHEAFDVGRELPTYLVPAQQSLASGFKAVIYGHTHLAKRVRSGDGGVYLNTGTWADIMRVPQAVLDGDESAARRQLQAFVDDLSAGRVDEWRCQLPTFARIELDGEQLLEADLYSYDGRAPARVPDGPLQLLAHTPQGRGAP